MCRVLPPSMVEGAYQFSRLYGLDNGRKHDVQEKEVDRKLAQRMSANNRSYEFPAFAMNQHAPLPRVPPQRQELLVWCPNKA